MKKVMMGAALASAFCGTAGAEKSQIGVPTGKWTVHGEVDPMTDKMDCIAYYDGKKSIQVTRDSFAVGYGGRGGLSSYTLRFDNNPPLELDLPRGSEKRMDAFIIDDTDQRFAQMIAAKRVRIQALTVLRGLVNDDIDLTDLQTVLARLKRPGCA